MDKQFKIGKFLKQKQKPTKEKHSKFHYTYKIKRV